MATTKAGAPSLETQLDFLVHEMGTANGGNVTSQFNPDMSSADAAIAFERHFERSGGSALNRRINNARDVRAAAANGTLSTFSPNVGTSYNYLVSQGFTPNQAAGIVGNLMAESGASIDPNAFNPAGGGQGAWGIAQWRADRQRNLLGWDGEAVVPSETFTPDPEDVTDVDGPEAARELTATERDISRGGGQSFYEDNILNTFDSYTYNWAIHMVHPTTATEFEANLNRGTYVTIAESGVDSEIGIETVIQSQVLAFERQNRNAVSNIFDITLLEPLGFTLMNRIMLAANELGIENHLVANYLLELNFRGWRDGDAVSTIIGPYYYMTTIVDFQVKHNESATTYQVNFIETEAEAYSKLDYHMKSDIDVVASDFGTFLTEFQDAINEETIKQTATTKAKLYPVEYRFDTEPDAAEWKSWAFDEVIGEQLQESRSISASASGGTVTFNFKAGTAITSAIAAALLQTKEFKKIPVLNGTAKDTPADGEAKAPKLAELIKWFSFSTNVEYSKFDPLARSYAKRIFYNVKAYITPEGFHDPISFSTLNSDRTLQRTRLDNILRNGLLKKRFDYTFTGLNTEVLNLDLTFNNMFFALQPINGGATSSDSSFFGGLDSDETAALGAKSEFENVRQRINQLNREKREANIRANQMEDLASVENVRSVQTEIENQTRSLTGQLTDDAIAATRRLAENARNSRATLNRSDFKYITQSDVYSNSALYNQSIAKSMNWDYRDVKDSLSVSGADTSEDIGSAMLGAMELNLNSTGEMVEQRIEIRGDPYWLGKPKGARVTNSGEAEYSKGGVGYFLHVRFPLYDGEDGFMQQELTNFSITALFRVTNVTSMYMNGEFKQTLESFRDTNTNVPELIDQLMTGKLSNPGRRSLSPSQFVDGDGDGVAEGIDVNGDGVIDDSEIIDSGARGGDFGSVSGDTDGVDNRLLSALDTAAQAAGVTAVVSSGDRGPGGSGRHDGYAADTQLYSNGRLLSVENPADLAIIQNYTNAYLDATRAAGLTPSVGIGNPAYGSGSELYMGGTAFHYDIARTPSIGANLSPNAGPYWGGSGRTSHHRPPQWLVDMYNS